MKHLKHRKLLVAILGIVTISVMILYLWVGAFVLQVFPHKGPQYPGSASSAQKFSDELTSTHKHGTLAQIDEKKVPAPTSNHTVSNAGQLGNRSENQESQNEKPFRGKRHELLQLLGAHL